MASGFNNLPPGINAPFGPYVGTPSPGRGNPANSGMAPPSGIATGNPLIDIALNMVVSGMTGGKPLMKSFSRPQVSDYAYRSMQERQRVSTIMSPDIAASNPIFNPGIFGDISKNRLFQQAMDSFASPGGSMSDAFNTVYGRFTNDLAGPGIRNAKANGVLAANFVKNADKAFLDEDGIFDYGKTSGFNRTEVYQNLAAYNQKFGGGFSGRTDGSSVEGSGIDGVNSRIDDVVQEIGNANSETAQARRKELEDLKGSISQGNQKTQEEIKKEISGTANESGGGFISDLAMRETPENRQRQERGRQQILEVQSMTREAQNLFGQDLDPSELMDKIGDMVEGDSTMTTGKARDMMQKMQALGVVVDMSNDAIVKYFDVVNNMYKGMGVRSSGTANMAQSALLAGNAIADARKQAVGPGGMYTGPGGAELAQGFAAAQANTINSERDASFNAWIDGLGTEGAEGELRRKIQRAKASDDVAEKDRLIQEAMDSGMISRDKYNLIETSAAEQFKNGRSEASIRDEERELAAMESSGDPEQIALAKALREKSNATDPMHVSRRVAESVMDKAFGDDRNTGATAGMFRDALGEGALEEFSKFVEDGGMSGNDAANKVEVAKKLKEKYSQLTDEQASSLASSFSQRMKNSEVATQQDLDNMIGPEEAEKYREKLQLQGEVDADIKSMGQKEGDYLRNFEMGDISAAFARTSKSLQKKGVKNVTFETLLAAGGPELKRMLLGDRNWDDLSKEEQQEALNTASKGFQTVTGETLTSSKSGMRGIDIKGIYEKAHAAATTTVDQDMAELDKIEGQWKSPEDREAYRQKMLDEETSKEVKKLEDEHMTKGVADEQSGQGGKGEEKDSMDSKQALTDIINAIMAVRDAVVSSDKKDFAVSASNSNMNVRAPSPVEIAKV